MRILLRDVRLAFPSLWKATAPATGGEAAFSASFILPKDHKQYGDLVKALKETAKEKWGAKSDTVYKALEAADKLCLHNGDTKAEYSGFEGNFYVSARNATRPLVIDKDKSPLTEQDGKPYAGCYVNASVEFFAYDNTGKGVSASLGGVQFVKDGDAFAGGKAASEDDFDALDGADADDLV